MTEQAIEVGDVQYREITRINEIMPLIRLIDTCFSPTMDQDGRDYLESLRKFVQRTIASGMTYPGLIPLPMQGIFCRYDGEVIGNLTFIPFLREPVKRYLIANVCVKEPYRGKGIGEKLTKMGIAKLKSLSCDEIWLHVRTDNQTAIQLYLQNGFEIQHTRTSWVQRNSGSDFHVNTDANDLEKISRKEWPHIRELISKSYPVDIRWNLPLNVEGLRPGLAASLERLIAQRKILGLTNGKKNGQAQGLIWEKTRLESDTLWLAADEQISAQEVRQFTEALRWELDTRKPFMINYPSGVLTETLENSGFTNQMTLHWMKKKI